MGSINRGFGYRSLQVMALMAAALSANPLMSHAEALDRAGGYESHGKGRGRSFRSMRGLNNSVRNNRAAAKSRNVARHRKACKG